MQLQFIAQAAADALLAGQPLSQPQKDALLLLWPTLLRLTAALPGAASDATPFAASACTVVLAQRPDASAGGRAAHLIDPTAARLLSSDDQHAATCTFELAAPATAEETRELQVRCFTMFSLAGAEPAVLSFCRLYGMQCTDQGCSWLGNERAQRRSQDFVIKNR